jgi:hypothetical protein
MNKHLATYLNDHLAGAVAGIEIAKHLEDHARSEDFKTAVAGVRCGIEKDEAELRDLAGRLGLEQSSIRKAAAWIAEKGTEVKLAIDDPSDGDFRIYEALEALSLGIEGKRCLWLALESAGVSDSRLTDTDLRRLQRRSEEQRITIEELRLDAARAAFEKR